MENARVKHTGGCHCGAVKFEVWNSPDILVFDCNCSICTKKQNRHFIVPKQYFTLLQGLDNLTTYTFNTHTAKHTFCSTCGVQSFYTPRSNPDGYGIAPHCLDQGTVGNIIMETFCGENWEKSMQNHKTIQGMSKLVGDSTHNWDRFQSGFISHDHGVLYYWHLYFDHFEKKNIDNYIEHNVL